MNEIITKEQQFYENNFKIINELHGQINEMYRTIREIADTMNETNTMHIKGLERDIFEDSNEEFSYYIISYPGFSGSINYNTKITFSKLSMLLNNISNRDVERYFKNLGYDFKPSSYVKFKDKETAQIALDWIMSNFVIAKFDNKPNNVF